MKKNNKQTNLEGGYGKYIVTENQNIFDVAVDIHGTVDGLTDILIHNQWLDIDTELKGGNEIIYTSDVMIDDATVEDLDRMNITPITGEHKVYYKEPIDGAVMDMFILTNTPEFVINKNGGSIYIDWGDNSDIEHILPGDVKIRHEFDADDVSGIRRVRMYVDKEEKGSMKIDTPVVVNSMVYDTINMRSYEDDSEITDVRFVRLFNGIQTLKLNNLVSVNLEPIALIESLQDIEILTRFTTPEAMDSFFISIIDNYGSRMPAKIKAKVKPNGKFQKPSGSSMTGMEAVWQIVNDPEWNTEFHKWQIIIDGVDYSQVASVKDKQ